MTSGATYAEFLGEQIAKCANEPPNWSERLARHLIERSTAAGWFVVREGELPPWMEKVSEQHERLATPEEVDDGCELGVAFDDLYRIIPRVGVSRD